MAKNYRNANGQGSVYKLSGNRRRPWVAAVTLGWEVNPDTGKAKQIQKPIGYYETKLLASAALAEYNQDPYDLAQKSLTFAEVYERWSSEYFPTLTNQSGVRTYKSTFMHSQPLHDMPMKDIKVAHLEDTIKNAQVGDATKGKMKSMYNMMYRYAMKHEIVKTDYAALCNGVKVGVNAPKVPFSDAEVQTLWERREESYIIDMALIEIYSGWRPQELAILKTEDIDLEQLIISGGMKTDAGKNRIVPIHSAIVDIVKMYYDPGNEYLFKCEDGTNMTYDKYYNRFTKTMKLLDMDHAPHETRHTFITLAKKYNVNEYVLKRIVGHQIKDITEGTYTHRDIENLREEIEKIKAPIM